MGSRRKTSTKAPRPDNTRSDSQRLDLHDQSLPLAAGASQDAAASWRYRQERTPRCTRRESSARSAGTYPRVFPPRVGNTVGRRIAALIPQGTECMRECPSLLLSTSQVFGSHATEPTPAS